MTHSPQTTSPPGPMAAGPRGRVHARLMKSSALALIVLAVAGCSLNPQPFTPEELQRFANDRSQRAVAETQEPVTDSIDLYEAMARAIKYNLDHKLEVAEYALRFAELREGEFDMLPDLVARVNWSDRDVDPFTESRLEGGGLSPGEPSTSEVYDGYRKELELSWDILDYGLAYYRSKQDADRVLIAEEQRRSTINRVIEDVRTAYWRAVAAERLAGQLNRLEGQAQRALSEAREQVSSGDGNRIEALRYQREMLEVLRSVKELRRDLAVAKDQLAALMNIPQDQDFSVAVPSMRSLGTPFTAMTSEEMTELALVNRPEMREIAYRLRINEVDEDAGVLRLLPSMEGYAGLYYDSNDLLVNQNYAEWGARISWDLMNLVRYPRLKRVLEGQETLLDARALALTQAIATQVHVSNARFHSLQHESHVARELHVVSSRISTQARDEFDAGTGAERDLVREELNAILASVRYYATYAELHGAFANVYAAVGLDSFDGSLTGNESVDVLAGSLRELWRSRGDR